MGRRVRRVLPTPCFSPPARPTARARSTTAPAPRHRRRRETPAFHDRLPPGASRLDRQASPLDRHARLSRLHRQRAWVPWRPSKTWWWPCRDRPGIEVNTRRLFQEAGRLGLGRFIVVTKMDADNVDYRSDLAAIRETFGTFCVPFNVPVGQGSTFSGVIDVIQSHDEDPAAMPAGTDRGVSHGRRADRRARRGPDDALPRGRDRRTRRAAPGRPRRDLPGQARAGALCVHSQGPRPSRAARPDLHLRPEPRPTSIASARAAAMPTHRKKRSCPPRRERWSPRSSRRSTISSWESSATCAS